MTTHTRLTVCCALFFFCFHIQTAKKSACWVDIAAGVCKNKADWTPDAPFSDTATCSGWAASIGFTATAQCTGTSAYGPWASITAMAAQKCCGTCKFIHDDSIVCVFFPPVHEASTECENRRILICHSTYTHKTDGLFCPFLLFFPHSNSHKISLLGKTARFLS